MSYKVKMSVVEETSEMGPYGLKNVSTIVIDLGDESQEMDSRVLAALLRGVAERVAPPHQSQITYNSVNNVR